jgi:hypothetical protein
MQLPQIHFHKENICNWKSILGYKIAGNY